LPASRSASTGPAAPPRKLLSRNARFLQAWAHRPMPGRHTRVIMRQTRSGEPARGPSRARQPWDRPGTGAGRRRVASRRWHSWTSSASSNACEIWSRTGALCPRRFGFSTAMNASASWSSARLLRRRACSRRQRRTVSSYGPCPLRALDRARQRRRLAAPRRRARRLR
jgi:hypothetical protein